MGKTYTTLKIEDETLKEFKQAKRLREFKMDKSITISEFLGLMIENEFKRYDNQTIKKVE